MSSSEQKLIIDCQLLQSNDRQRGMGLFLFSLLTALEQSNAKLVFITNRNLPSLSQSDSALLNNMGGEIIALDLVSKAQAPTFSAAAETNRSNLDRALKKHLANEAPAVFFIPAMFSNDIYPVFPSEGTANAMLFHDIIPYLYHQHYFKDHEGDARKDYAQRFAEVYKSDLIVTNSQTTADDLSVYFGFDAGRVKPIFGAAADRTKVKPKAPGYASSLKDGFVLMPSGDDFRKNNARAAQAMAELKSGLKLVITSNFTDASQQQLKEIYPQTVFTGSVSDSEYLWLMENAHTVVFPSEYEGLGMPILEAAACSATIICSNIPVFVEISSEAFFFFDPNSSADLTAVLQKVLSLNAGVIEQKKQHYERVLKKFDWTKTADLFLKAVRTVEQSGGKRRLAVFCPSPTSYSAIGKYVFELHAELSRYFDIDYYAEEGSTDTGLTRPNILEYAANNYYHASEFSQERAKDYDHVLYNIGNSEFHVESVLNALRLPANTIFHDTRLNGLFDYMVDRKIIPPERRQFELLLDKEFADNKTSCLTSLASNQEAIICHSDFAKQTVSKLAVKTEVLKLELPTEAPLIEINRPATAIVSFAGIISETKGINLVSQVSQLDKVNVKVFGFGVLGDSPLLANIKDLEVLKDLTDKEFQDSLRTSDILVSYRQHYFGETSLSTLEAMRYGTVVIVNNVGWYAELPDKAAVKVSNEVEVMDAIKSLIADPDKRFAISKSAREYVRQNHGHKQYAKKLAERVI